MTDPWPPGVPETLWNYALRDPMLVPSVPMMGTSMGTNYLYAFSFGALFVLLFALHRFRSAAGDNKFGYKVIDDIPVYELGGAAAMRRAYLIYAGCLVTLYVAMTFLGS